MSLAIIWRNPKTVHCVRRRRKLIHNLSGTIYVVQELVLRGKDQQWAYMSTLEVVRGGHVEEASPAVPIAS
jgi:hypothetical protein